jgi:transglutaminase-like putative cysteine protease
MNDQRRYQVRHETVYAYGGEVAHSHQLLHLTPRELAHQSCTAHRILLDPEPTLRREALDAFGNPVTRLEYDRPHERLEVVSEATVHVESLPPADAACSETWEEVSRSLDYRGQPLPPAHLDAARYRAESPYVRIKQRFGDYAADCFAPDLPLALCAESLMRKVHREFSYAPGTTDITTSGLDAFEARAGARGALRQRLPAHAAAGRQRPGTRRGRRLARLGVGVLPAARLDRLRSDQRRARRRRSHHGRLGP